MVGAQCATFFPPATNPFPPPRKPVIVLSSISNPFPSKPTKRKNYLRQKLLKTLTNPVIPKTPSTNCVIPFVSPQEQPPLAKESEEIQELQSLTSEATAGIVRGKFGNFPTRWVLLFLVGAFIFRAICAVWASGLVNSDQKDENLDGGRETRVSESGLDGNGEEISVVFLRGSDDPLRRRLWFRQVGNGFVGGSAFEERINEIRAMAREAREKERLDSIVNGDDNVDGVRSGIDMEVYSELVNLRKSLQKTSEKAKDEKKPLVSRKTDELRSPLITQKTLRSPLSNLQDKPKGFNSSDNPSITRNTNSSSVVEGGSIRNERVDCESVDCENVDLLEEGHKLGNGKAKENLGNGNGVAKLESGNGSTQGNDIRRPLFRGVSSSNSTIGSKVEGRDSDDKADLWWLSLPYVLVICCHDVDGAKGLFTLESKGDASHTIAFEDQGDATNFCYLLQSSFEDLGDFSAEIVPVPTKELNEAGSSDNMKVIVVKKGELELYAGQPLEEVEMALRSLVQ